MSSAKPLITISTSDSSARADASEHSGPDSSTSRFSPEAANWIFHRSSSMHPRAELGIPEDAHLPALAPDHLAGPPPRRGDQHQARPAPLGRGKLPRRLAGSRRPTFRYERSVRLFTAFLTRAATLTCYKKQTT